MVELYVIVGIIVVALLVTLLARRGGSKDDDDLATRLGLDVMSETEDGSTRLAGTFRGIEVEIVIGRKASSSTVLEAKVRGRPAPGTVEALLGKGAAELDLAFDDGALTVRESDSDDAPNVEPDPELQESLERLRERFPGAKLDLSEELVRFSTPSSEESAESIEQALRDVVDLAETLEFALAESDAGVLSWDRTSSPSFIPPESSAGG